MAVQTSFPTPPPAYPRFPRREPRLHAVPPPPPRVALLSTYHQHCGIATYAENLVEGLESAGAEVSVFAPTLKKGDTGVGEQPPRLWAANRAFGIEALRVANAVERSGCKVAHLNVNLSLFSSRFLFVLSRVLRARGIPVVATLHGRQGGSLGRRFKVWRIYQALRGARIIVHSDSHADELRAAGHRDVHVIPHGMPPIERRPLLDARARLGIDPSRTVIAHFGFLVPDKGVREMVEAIAELRRTRHPELFYWISGAVFRTDESRRCFEDIKAAIAHHGLESHVHLTGEFVPHEDAILAMQAADWVVLNYRTGNSQGASGAISRAFASGRPVAVSSAPVFDEVRRAAHTLEGDLPLALDRLLGDEALAGDATRRATTYCARASWANVAARHIELYADLVR